MHEEDPTWIVEQSKELKQTIVSGQGEFHLRTLKWRIENNEKLMVEFQEPRIPYRETITKAARADYRHKKQSGGAGQFGEGTPSSSNPTMKEAGSRKLQVWQPGVQDECARYTDHRPRLGRKTGICKLYRGWCHRRTLPARHTQRSDGPHGTRPAHRLVCTRRQGMRIRWKDAPRRFERNLVPPGRTQRIQRSLQERRTEDSRTCLRCRSAWCLRTKWATS